MQVDARERGFSYSYDAPLDMRMDPSQELDAREIVNEWDERRLAAALPRYGEERYARRIAREIVRRRERAPIETTGELVDAIEARDARRRGAASPAGTRPSASSRRSGSRSTTSSTRSTARCPLAWELLRRGRPAGGDLLPLARGPAREALPRRARARLHLPARLPGLRLRARARGRAAHPPRRRAHARRGRRQPARASRAGCAPPRKLQRRSRLMARAARSHRHAPRRAAPQRGAAAPQRAAPGARAPPARRTRRRAASPRAVRRPRARRGRAPGRVLSAPFARAARARTAASSTRSWPAAAGSRSSACCSPGSSSSTSTCSR